MMAVNVYVTVLVPHSFAVSTVRFAHRVFQSHVLFLLLSLLATSFEGPTATGYGVGTFIPTTCQWLGHRKCELSKGKCEYAGRFHS